VTVYDDTDTSRFHPLADAFPLIEGAEFGELVADIDNNGLLSPIVMFEGKILDGRNRWRACQRLQVPHTEKQFTGDDPAAYVWSVNAIRRQLTPSQKAMAATKLVTAKQGDNRNTVGDKVTTAQAAKLAGVGEKTVKRARVVIADAVPEVQKAVESGDVSVYTAERIARMDPHEQTEIMRTTDLRDLPSAVPESGTARKPHRALSSVPAPLFDDGTDGENAPVKGPGRGYVGPITQITRQLEAYSPEGAKLRVKQWAEHRELITQIDGGELDQFLTGLKAERKAIEQLIRLIKIERDRVAALAQQGGSTPEQEK
jgi:ParB-like chromosome segregation protein Spo0J